MKTRNLFAGALVGALAVGIWLGSFWKGPGPGGLGTGFGTTAKNNSEEGNDSAVSAPASVLAPGNPKELPASPDPLEDFPTDMMTVVIYGNEYRLVEGDAPQAGKVISPEEIANRAKKMTGTPEGIRIRILKGKSAQEGARADLMKILTENGVKREEIQERAEFVD